MKKAGGIGFVMLVVVMAIVLWLTAENWKKVAPTALDVNAAGASVEDHGQTGAAESLRSGDMPRLSDTREATDAHTEDVQAALDSIE